jgi:hypothetical protein
VFWLVGSAPVLLVETHDADDDLLLLLISFVLVLLLFLVIGRRLCLSSLFCRNHIPVHHMSGRLVKCPACFNNYRSLFFPSLHRLPSAVLCGAKQSPCIFLLSHNSTHHLSLLHWSIDQAKPILMDGESLESSTETLAMEGTELEIVWSSTTR